jgi:hypothetical protein
MVKQRTSKNSLDFSHPVFAFMSMNMTVLPTAEHATSDLETLKLFLISSAAWPSARLPPTWKW